MDELHPLFRDDIPSIAELRSNDIYSALVEISSQRDILGVPKDRSTKAISKEELGSCKVSVSSKKINKAAKPGCLKGKYYRHISKVEATRSRLEAKKLERASNHTEENKGTRSPGDSDERERAEMEICMSLWSNKSLFDG